jgi:hypothetical protein
MFKAQTGGFLNNLLNKKRIKKRKYYGGVAQMVRA